MKARAAALINAIYVCLVIAILAGVFLILFNLEFLLFNNFKSQDLLIKDHKSAVEYFISKGYIEEKQELSLKSNRTLASCWWKRFGFFYVLNVEVNNGERKISKSFLVGISDKHIDNTTLFLKDSDRLLSVGDSLKIFGDIKIPNGKIKLGGSSPKYSHEGKVSSSAKILPGISDHFKFAVLFDNYEEGYLFAENDETSFLFDLKRYFVDNLTTGTFKGNKILENDKEIRVGPGVILENVILRAPRIIFESGFEGNCQAFAEEEIVIEDYVKLTYPSMVVVTSQKDSLALKIGNHSKVEGGVILKSESGKTDGRILINKGAILHGTLYSTGDLDFKGTINGKIFTSRFLSRAANFKSYDINTLNGGVLDIRNFPSYYFGIIEPRSKDYVILQEL